MLTSFAECHHFSHSWGKPVCSLTDSVQYQIWIQRHTADAIIFSMFSRVLCLCKIFQLRTTSQKHASLYSRAQFSPRYSQRTGRCAYQSKNVLLKLLLHQSRHVDGDATSSYAVDVRDYGYAMYKYSVELLRNGTGSHYTAFISSSRTAGRFNSTSILRPSSDDG